MFLPGKYTRSFMNKKNKIILAVSIFTAAVCLLLCLPPVRTMILIQGNAVAHKNINFNYWGQQIFGFSVLILICIAYTDFALFTKKGKEFHHVVSADFSLQTRANASQWK